MDVSVLLKPEVLAVVPTLMVIGTVLKGLQSIPDKFIPSILVVCGIGLSIGLLGVSVESVIQGVLLGGASVGIHQAGKQIVKKDE